MAETDHNTYTVNVSNPYDMVIGTLYKIVLHNGLILIGEFVCITDHDEEGRHVTMYSFKYPDGREGQQTSINRYYRRPELSDSL
jgi:hypothetical protein